VRYLVVSLPSAGDRRDELREAEEAALADMVADGFIVQIYRRDDGRGAYSIVEAPSAADARRRLDTLPFVRQQAISIEIIPVTARY
jgi:muconolactone delta-isomerase